MVHLYIIYFYLKNDEFVKLILLAFFKVLARFSLFWPVTCMGWARLSWSKTSPNRSESD